MPSLDYQIRHAEAMLRQARRDRGAAWALPSYLSHAGARSLVLEATGRVHMWADELERLYLARHAARQQLQLSLPEDGK